MRTFVTTVGVSLATNHSRFRPDAPPLSPDELFQWASSVTWQEASAESNTWHQLGVGGEDDQVLLLHSETHEGESCAVALSMLARKRGVQAGTVRVRGLTNRPGMGPNAFNRGLARLAHAIIDAISAGRGRGSVEIVATGGFKPEASIAHQVGAILQVPVHYIHEALREVVTLEPLPVALDLAWVQSGPGRALLNRFTHEKDALIPLQEIESLLRQDERLQLLMDTDAELGVAGLNVLGQLAIGLLGGPPLGWPEPSHLPPEQKLQICMDHHKPRGWDAWLSKMARSAYVTSIRFEQVRLGSGRMIGPAPASESELLGCYSDGDIWRGVRIGTTCTNSGQRQMVENLLNKELAR